MNVQQLAEQAQIDDCVVVLSYILFASVEFQQRNVKIGTDLAKRCSKFLTENLASLHARQNSTASQAVHQVVTPFMLRKAVTIATLGNGPSSQLVANDEVGGILETVLSRSGRST